MRRVFELLIFLLVLLSVSCSDHSLLLLIEEPEIVENSPNITVIPSQIDFGPLDAEGAIGSRTVTIENTGLETLDISNIRIEYGNEVYTITDVDDIELEPGEKTDFDVFYDPVTYEVNNGVIYIYSNDPTKEIVEVPLVGSGDAPVIWIDPYHFDYGDTLIGCNETEGLFVWNIGNVDLEIYGMDFFISYPANLSIMDVESHYGPFPWVLPPDSYVIVEVTHSPTDFDFDYGDLYVYSNDPYSPETIAEQSGGGSYEDLVEEIFVQEEISDVDILFVVDNSGSMAGNQSQLAQNIETFMNVFITSGIHYNIGFITTDDATALGPVVDPTSSDPVTEIQNIIDNIGTMGSPTEKGIEYAYEAMQSGNDFGPGSAFWRYDAKLIVIFISDEDDFGNVTPSTLSSYMVAVKGNADYAIAHAVAGDYPGGCSANGGATEGYQYYTLVNLLGGTFLSICQDDWGTPLETLANDSILKSKFTLQNNPIEETITVKVDGAEQSTGWYYDSSTNSVVFDQNNVPQANSIVYISYNPVSDCER
jgi:hypothetical protein